MEFNNGDQFIKDRGIKAWAIVDNRKPFTYSLKDEFDKYSCHCNSVKMFEAFLKQDGWKPYNREPEIKVGDRFTNNDETITIGRSGAGYFVAIWPDGFSRAEVGPYSLLKNLTSRLKDLNFYKVVKEENMETKIEVKFEEKVEEIDIKPKQLFTKNNQIVQVVAHERNYALLNIRTSTIFEVNSTKERISNWINQYGYKPFKGEIKITQ